MGGGGFSRVFKPIAKVADAVTGGMASKVLGGEGAQEAPQAPDFSQQQKQAEDAARAMAEKELKDRPGRVSTILGGGISEDNANLKKKKLLGE